MQIRSWQRTIVRRGGEPRFGTPHAGKMDRWLGAANVAHLSAQFRHWYGPPVPVGGIPGNVWVTAGGEFAGHIDVGNELTHEDLAEAIIRRQERLRFAKASRQHGAFTSLSALIAARTGGKSVTVPFSKTGVASNATNNSNDLWSCAGQPAAGSAGAAAPGGTATTNGTTGNWGFTNAVANANTSHFLGGWVLGTVAANSLLIIDQLIRVAKTMASTTTEAVTGTFSRYQDTVAGSADYIGGNFLFPSNPTTVLAATAHNWTVCQYTNQAGSAGQSAPSATGVSACVVHGIDLAAGAGSWFMPLASGDVGVKALTQMQCSASVATGTIDFVVAHPIAMLPVWLANQACLTDALTTAIDQLEQVYDNACISAIEVSKPATTATSYSGKLTFCSE
jgi:hypothetical protein